MKWVKFITRKYTMLEHWLITESLSKENTSIPGIYYNGVIDISRKGLVDVYMLKEDEERNKKWVIDSVKKDSRFLDRILKKGLNETKKLSKLPTHLLNNIPKLSDKKIIEELYKLKQMFFDYSGYLDLIHHIEKSGVKISEKNIKEISKFNDFRKETFMGYFKFLRELAKRIVGKKKKSQMISLI